ncbi:MAG: gamma-glutamyltransferase, partial [Terriglobia bacterium]
LAMCVTNAASCGIGGGGFMLIYTARTGTFHALDFRERAPLKASPNMYLQDGRPVRRLSLDGALAVAVPGEIAGLGAALSRFGTMKFQAVAAPAIRLARDGFPASAHLAREIAYLAPRLARDPAGLGSVFLNPDGAPRKEGHKIVNRNLARTLESLGNDPVRNFYHGPVARQISSYMKSRGGLITGKDLAQYKALWRQPLQHSYHGYEVHTVGPPASGAVVLEMLAMLEPDHPGTGAIRTPTYLARLIEVMRQGFIDRALYADPAFARVPIERLLSSEHLAKARRRALERRPGGVAATAEPRDHGTANLCVVDSEGNVVVLTTTINTAFGAKLMVPKLGIILNNEMDDFAIAPGVPNVYGLAGAKANEIAPGKRPLSSISPVILTRDGRPVLALGASGGPRIITGVLQVILNVIDRRLGVAQAIAKPRLHQQAYPASVFVEDTTSEAELRGLEKMGYQLQKTRAVGAVSAIAIAPGRLEAVFDRRKGGGAAGY